MHCFLVHKCLFPQKQLHVLYEKLVYMQCCYDTDSIDTDRVNEVASDVYKLVRTHFSSSNPQPGHELQNEGRVCIVGKQGRYLLYSGDGTTTPSIVLMIQPEMISRDVKNGSWHKPTTDNPDDKFHDNSTDDYTNHIRIFSCDTTIKFSDNTSEDPQLGDTSSDLLCDLENIHIKNGNIQRKLKMFSHVSTTPIVKNNTRPDIVSPVASDIEVVVRIPHVNGTVALLPVMAIGIQSARDALRSVGCLQFQCAHDERMGLELVENELRDAELGTIGGLEPSLVTSETRKVIIAQDHVYTLIMHLCDGTFKLYLHHTDDLFECDEFNETPTAIAVVSHNFHNLDSIVEQINRNYITYKKNQDHVFGMIAVVNTLLRQNVVAAPVRSIGSNCNTALYTDLHPVDIAQALGAMGLLSDKPHIVKTLNRIYRSVVVRHTMCAIPVDKKCNGLIPPVSAYNNNNNNNKNNNNSVDFRLHHSGALNYAIAHQNMHVTRVLNRNMGLDMKEISTALYSGIAFCHSCAYSCLPTTGSVHLINETDFTKTSEGKIQDMIDCDTQTFLSANPAVEWITLRHNFQVQTDGRGAKERRRTPVLIVKCCITENGLILFRRFGKVDENFIGGVYIAPGIYKHYILKGTAKMKSTEDDIPTNITPSLHTPDESSSHSFPHPVHAIVPIIKKLATKTIVSKSDLLQNATELLFHINAICIHNTRSGYKAKKSHEMLRNAWLVKYMVCASRICEGVCNADFCSIYAHLANLASLPLNSAGYWATVPYV
jgi:hypothetical protein